MYNEKSFLTVESTLSSMTQSSIPLTFPLPHPDDTDALATRLAKAIELARADWFDSGLVLTFDGDLGAGKTTFARALLRAWGFRGPVKSPTFSLVETYPVLEATLNHFDFYRFESPYEFDEAGMRDLFGRAQICITEWTEKARPFVPEADIVLSLRVDGLGRQARLEALSTTGQKIIGHLS